MSELTNDHDFKACWDRETGELTLEKDDVVILATHDPFAFEAGVRLLADGYCVAYVNWCLPPIIIQSS